MANKGAMLKYVLGFTMAVLLADVCAVETLDFSDAGIALQFNYPDEPLHHRKKRDAELMEYIVIVEVNVSQAVVIELIKSSLASIIFPLQLDNGTEITEVNVTTVCQPNATEYQCKCEDGYAWSYDNCKAYESCDDIRLAPCGCINGIPADGEMCLLQNELPKTDFLLEIELEASIISMISDIRRVLGNFTFPLQLNDLVEVLDLDITTVCDFNATGYQCKCEDQYFWPCDMCTEHGSCSDTNDTCSCVSTLIDGQFCQPISEMTEIRCMQQPAAQPSDYMIDVDVGFFDFFLVNYLRNLTTNIGLPLTLSNNMNVTEIDMTTVCGLNGTEYVCKCEDHHVWSSDTCAVHQVCDDIVGGTCGCIQGLPSEGQLCQRDMNECEDAESVCGPNSYCSNIIGSHMCSCRSGFAALNRNSPVSLNNPCVLILPLTEYQIEIQINTMNTAISDQLRTLLMSFSLPYTINDRTNITDISMTTVCSLNEKEYQCKCEGLFVWPNDTCHSYETCDNITDGSCTCINALPSNGPFCQLKKGPISIYMIDVDVRFFDSLLVNDLRNLITNINLPLTLNNKINVTDIDMTTVCGLNGTEYLCKCEDHHVWSSDTCAVHQVCDDIVGGTCGCIQGLPSEGQLCQRDKNECEDAESVCGPNSYCSNIIGSHMCSCWSGFAALNRNSPVSLNNPCVLILPLTEYQIEIQINTMNTAISDQLRTLLMSFSLPYTINDRTNITEISMTTVCSLNEKEYQCKCEGLFVWPNDTCHSYETCDNITDGACTCINALPSNGPFCQLKKGPISIYMIDVDVRFFDSLLVNDLRNLITNINLPLTLNNKINVTDIDMTTVCGLNGTEYLCKCEDHHVWSSDTCEVHQVCDDIVGGTCGCIQGLPSGGQLCQRDMNECEDAESVCGPNSYCSNIIGSHMCSCRSGFAALNRNSPVSLNNPCVLILPLTEYQIEIQINTMNTAISDQLRTLLMSFSLPYTINDRTNITEISMTTVCSLNEMEYQCKCEGLFVWPNDTCHSYETCDNITDGACTCINALPSNGPFCQLKKGPISIYMIDVDVRFFDSLLVNDLRNLITNINLPLTLNSNINVTDIDMTTVCGLMGTEYLCKCEDHHVWSSDTCEVHQVCDDIVGGTCGCIQGLPSGGQLCQRDMNECEDAESVCGPNSYCSNIIGSHMCSCRSGFAALNRNSPVSLNNPCVLILPLTEYQIEIQINTMNTAISDQLRTLLMSFSLPYTINDRTNITEISMTTVCSLNEKEYQCKCEGLFVWPNDTCHSYETCDNITDGACTCINALPSNGPFCQLKKGPISIYMIDVDVRFFDSLLVNDLRNLITNINLPLTLNNKINVTDIDMTTVCGLNGTEYLCKCEDHHVWSNDTCEVHQVCDDIVGGTCGCIQGLPSGGQLCQRDMNECEDTESVCGPNSYCSNIIGSHMCSCWSGFAALNRNSPVSLNNPCVLILPLTEYQIEIQINTMNTAISDQLRTLLMSFSLPYTINDRTNITEISMTTVCSLNEMEYQCKCEGLFVWPNDTCHSYETCDNITDGACTCINALPSNGPFCQLKKGPISIYMIDVDVRFFDSLLVNDLRNLITNINLPLTLNSNINVTDIDMTTVCGLNGTEYLCKCEDHHVWSNDTCEVHQVCDDIVGGTCGCIQGLPSGGQLCQRDMNECEDTESVCGPNSYCSNIIGSHMCSCWSGFAALNRNSPVSLNNPCVLILPLTEYQIEIQINTMNTAISDQLRTLLMSFSLPYTINDRTNITDISMTTVCSLNEMEYQCKCEGLFVWPNDTCHSYETCDNITDGACTCINALPSNGPFCQLKKGPISIYMIDVDVRFFDSLLENDLRNLITNINLPLTLNNKINVTDIDMTTVCGLNGTEYLCKCEDHHVWSNDTCEVHQVCDDIVGGTCGCIQGLPSGGQLCQRDKNECEDTESVCGPNSYCSNIIGSHMCSCWSGFAALNRNSPVSLNNPCVLILPLTKYQIEIQINTMNTAISDQLRTLLMSFSLPYTINDRTNITDISMTTVCSLNEMEYQCKCEGLFVWPNDTCHSYETCDNITDGSCTCINALPSNGPFCQLKKGPISIYMIDVDVRFFDSLLVNDLRNLITNINLPLTLNSNINVTNIDMTTVCGLNGTEYLCKCEDHHVWSNDTCEVHPVCDDIVGGTCGCIQGLPSVGQLCQRDMNECEDTESVCGPNSNCYNIIGSHMCSCRSGFAALNRNSPVSLNNSCVDVDECVETPEICGRNSICNNTDGSYNCWCMSGYVITDTNLPINNSNTCRDVNECVETPEICGPNSICNNTDGSYNCWCISGYDVTDPNLPINNSNPCRDVNECVETPEICGPNSICNNTDGSYNCLCMSGYNVTNPNLHINNSNPCRDVDECVETPEICGPNSICNNTDGSHNCWCMSGYVITDPNLHINNSNPCRDVNECVETPEICGPNSICNNTDGSYNCSCASGFNVTNPNLPINSSNPCIDIYECFDPPSVCGPNAHCHDYNGSFSCSCLKGYDVDGSPVSKTNMCTDVDECVETPQICGPNSICNNTDGSHNCWCMSGYNVTNPNLHINSGNPCRDVNECVETPEICGPNSICNNTDGSYNCWCMSGYVITDPNLPINNSNTCRDVNECVETPEICGPNSICNNTDGSYNCSCMSGYNVTDPNLPINNSNPCRDVNECVETPEICGPNSICNNTDGSYNCWCMSGYVITDPNLPINNSNTCRDVNECVETPEICGPNSICNNTDGSYNCWCRSGYDVTDPNLPINNSNPCRDVNECVETPEICGPNSICNNTDGSYNCLCMSGYNVTNPNLHINNSNTCRDVNECVETPEICGPNSICNNTDGSYNCSCVSGYDVTDTNLPINNSNTCRDVDECVETPEICGLNSICNNTDGSYNCWCMSGYNVTDPNLPINNSNPCRDVNECVETPEICGPNSICNNTDGSYNCLCMSGYNVTNPNLHINNSNPCRDVDECVETPEICGPNSICNNTDGSYNCSCVSGYDVTDPNLPINNSNPCRDVDECVETPEICGPNSICNNTDGSYNCWCMSGHIVRDPNLHINSGNPCRDVNECVETPEICGPNSICNNTDGSYNCSCASGFNVTNPNLPINSSNPCIDIYECFDPPSVCGPNAHCHDYNGSFSCSCLKGYDVNGSPVSKTNMCTDVDECVETPQICGPNSICNNTDGSYNCWCMSGYIVTNPNLHINSGNPCRDVNECVETPEICGPNSMCSNSDGSYNCTCRSGFTNLNLPINSSNPCRDVDECTETPTICGPHSMCSNTDGSYNCTCRSGFTNPNLPINNINPCRDVDECVKPLEVCGPNSMCSNTDGSYICTCMSGFTNPDLPINSSNPCRDVDECVETPEICGPKSTCSNTDGSYICTCMSGFTNPDLPINNSNPCRDVDECVKPLEVCGPNSICSNTDGSYICTCMSGFTNPDLPINSSNPCRDVDECVKPLEVCGPNSICSNTDGSYICTCMSGFTNPDLPINNSNPCRDVDECVKPLEVCGPNSICSNTDGSYICTCMSGFTNPNLPINSSNPCRDVDECVETPEICGPKSTCSNTDGSYICTCMSGFTNPDLPINSSNPCRDVDECVKPLEVCGPNSICTNTDGSYICTCMSGFTNPNLPINNSNPCKAPPTTVKMSMRINLDFDTGLLNKTDKKYLDYVKFITEAIEESYLKLPNYIKGSVKVTGFRSGSIIADYTINTVNSGSFDLSSANTQVSDALSKNGIPLALNAFEQSEETNMTTKDKYYSQQSMELRCTLPTSVVETIKWKVNDNNLVGNTTKYTITNDASGSTLKVIDLSERDNGRYSCVIERSPIPYVQWQKVVIEATPKIIVNTLEIQLECKDDVLLSCCAEHYSVEWVDSSPKDLRTSETGCITFQYSSTSCGTPKKFTCRLKDMIELREFGYSNTTVTVKTISVSDVECKNDTLGVGKLGNIVEGPCEKGLVGNNTYQCKEKNSKKEWELLPEKSNCVVKAIQGLEEKAELLVVEEIPAFMANLSKAAGQDNVTITQSAATVETIVEILSKVAGFSKNVTISQPVMKDFLKTVDIIVADESKETWAELNDGNTTDNRSTELLQAIEKISDSLSDNDFTINETTIQLTRKLIRNSFIEDSLLANSTTQIVIPNVEQALVTIIVFTKLDNVLPTRNTSKNDNRTSENRINGDVVVVRGNNTINNISFTFDITNTTLKNPQCVFWNFDLDQWDSTGCKVKHLGNEGNNVTCECNHTTSFSILMSPFAFKDPVQSTALAYITYIGVAISITSLILCLIIEMIVWESVKRNNTSYMRHVSIVNIAVSLLIANICFIIGAAIADQDIKKEQMISVARCSPVVFFMHFFYLALFFWMFVSALFLFYCTVMVFSQISKTKMMIIGFTVGYGAPLLIAVITVASTAGPENYVSKENVCWLNWTESKALLAFVIPALTIFFFNLMVVIVVMCKMLRRGVGAATQPNERHTLVVIARSVAVLTPIFGLTWGFGIGTLVSRNFGIHVVFAFLNSLQGLFILLFGLLFDSKIRDLLAGKLALRTLTSSDRTRTTTAGPPSSRFDFFRRMRRRHAYNIAEAATSSGVGSSENYSVSDAFGSA
ncbi:uncharacterized protein adgrf6 isoform X2 [Triplophysa dalaica]|uniref:uncharacterized protein adgrf6 isoform X2 n=1 Tax=Triplophysa dalaica TaxID=1582913 RepID=UPI0024DF3DD8|nr:uncharacterized protein adgrf6 isoform X2 [Triplophysa dalaica]